MKDIIGIDIDGTIRNFLASLENVYDKYYPNNGRKEVEEWDLSKFFPIGKEIWKFIYELHPNEIFLNALPYKGAKQFINWAKDKYRIKIITAQPDENSKNLAFLWLLKYNIYYDEIVYTYNKHEQDFTFILEDSPIHIPKINNVGKNVVCIKREWNKDVWGMVETVDNFNELKMKLTKGELLWMKNT